MECLGRKPRMAATEEPLQRRELEGQCALAQISGDSAESQRPLSFIPVTCSLAGVHQMLEAACAPASRVVQQK